MNKAAYLQIRTWFERYVSRFKGNKDAYFIKNIEMKENHSLRVCEEIERLAKQLDCNEEDIFLAKIIGLLHDIGRFEQFSRFKTFKDSKSINHAHLSVKILKTEKVLMMLSPEIQNIILDPIKLHNLARLPELDDDRINFFSRLLRDADKLDIYKVVTDYYSQTNKNNAIELELPDTPGISQEVYSDIMNERIVDMNKMQNFNDFKVLQISWIFDVNFLATLRKIDRKKFLDKIAKVLPDDEEIKTIVDKCSFYLKEKLRN